MGPIRLRKVASIPYGWAVAARGRLFDWGCLPRHSLSCPVISVGNLTVGGTGKTPFVIWLAQWLLEQGQRVAILSRGYRRTSRAVRLLVSDGKKLLASPSDAGDEPYLIARCCPGAIVAVGANRFRLGQWVCNQFPVDCFLLDDGFQHRALMRDGDVLLIDVSDPEGLEDLVPAGRLREPLAGAARATAIVLTRTDGGVDISRIVALLERSIGQKITPILSRFEAAEMWNLVGGDRMESTGSRVSGRRVMLCCGVGNPWSFRRLVERLSCRIQDIVSFPDHHVYTGSDVQSIRKRAKEVGAEMVLTTEKDAVKLAPLLDREDHVWAVRASLHVFEGEEYLKQMIGNLLATRPVRGLRNIPVNTP